MRPRRADDVERAFQVDGQNLVPIVVLHRLHVAVRDERRRPSIVDQHVQAAEGVGHLLHHAAHRRVVAHVAFDRHGPHAGFPQRLGGGHRLPFRARVIHRHVAALVRQGERDGPTGANAAAGDEGDFVFYLHTVLLWKS